MMKHIEFVKIQRLGYMLRKRECETYPEDVGSILLDFCSHKSFPHFSTYVKDLGMLQRLYFDLCGVINPGLRTEEFYPFLPVYSFTADINISILYHHIKKWRSNYRLPKRFYIQVSQKYFINRNIFVSC